MLLIASPGFAQQDEIVAVPNRPTVSTTAQPVQAGVLETEWGVNAGESHQDINGLLKFGLSENFELRLANDPLTADSGTHGIGDTAVGFKYRFTRDSGREPSIAFMYMAKLPTAGEVLGSGEPDHSFAVLISKDVGKHHFDFNSIFTILGRTNGHFDHDLLGALAWSHPVRGNWGATLEFSGVTSANRVTPAEAQFISAGTYTVRPRLVLDFGMMGRITGNIPDAMFMTGFTYSIADLYHRRLKKNDSR